MPLCRYENGVVATNNVVLLITTIKRTSPEQTQLNGKKMMPDLTMIVSNDELSL